MGGQVSHECLAAWLGWCVALGAPRPNGLCSAQQHPDRLPTLAQGRVGSSQGWRSMVCLPSPQGAHPWRPLCPGPGHSCPLTLPKEDSRWKLGFCMPWGRLSWHPQLGGVLWALASLSCSRRASWNPSALNRHSPRSGSTPLAHISVSGIPVPAPVSVCEGQGLNGLGLAPLGGTHLCHSHPCFELFGVCLGCYAFY